MHCSSILNEWIPLFLSLILCSWLSWGDNNKKNSILTYFGWVFYSLISVKIHRCPVQSMLITKTSDTFCNLLGWQIIVMVWKLRMQISVTCNLIPQNFLTIVTPYLVVSRYYGSSRYQTLSFCYFLEEVPINI